MIFVDTGYLWALLDKRDQLHTRAAAWHLRLSEPLVVTEYILWEMVNGFSTGEDRPKAHAAIDDIRTSADWQMLPASDDLFTTGLILHRRHADKDWSLTDCISFLVMKEGGIVRALTYDHHFEQAGFEALLRRDPP
jgi:predicted nucleic acid-binding protein